MKNRFFPVALVLSGNGVSAMNRAGYAIAKTTSVLNSGETLKFGKV